MTMQVMGIAGTVATDAQTVDTLLSVLADMDPNYYAVTKFGRCDDVNVPCDCLRCEYRDGMTEIDYTLDGTVQTARIVGLHN